MDSFGDIAKYSAIGAASAIGVLLLSFLIIPPFRYVVRCVLAPADEPIQRDYVEDTGKREYKNYDELLAEVRNMQELAIDPEMDTQNMSGIPNSDSKSSNVKAASNNSTFSIGEAAKYHEMIIGIQYAKRMDYLPTALGKTDISTSNEEILLFYEVLNDGSSSDSFYSDGFSCYADSKKVDSTESYIKLMCDGVIDYFSYILESKTQMIGVVAFEVPRGWSELTVFYKDTVKWTLSQNDVQSNDYSKMYLFPISNPKNVTQIGDAIYNDNYKIIYEGTDHFDEDASEIFAESYRIFKFRIENTSSERLDYEWSGSRMRAYADNYYMGDPNSSVSGYDDSFIDIYDLESVAPGMSADVFIAFPENDGVHSTYYMVFDNGLVFEHNYGEVYITN